MTDTGQIIERATALRGVPEIERCIVLSVLFGENIVSRQYTEAELFTAAYGDATGAAYWGSHLSEPMPANALASILAKHLVNSPDNLRVWREAVQAALHDAVALGTSDLVASDGVLINPRSAVKWMLGLPKRRHLVPESLRRYLNPEAGGTKISVPNSETARNSGIAAIPMIEPKRPGPKPAQMERVMREMRVALGQGRGLASEKGVALAQEFGAARSTCQKALKRVLSEIADN